MLQFCTVAFLEDSNSHDFKYTQIKVNSGVSTENCIHEELFQWEFSGMNSPPEDLYFQSWAFAALKWGTASFYMFNSSLVMNSNISNLNAQ